MCSLETFSKRQRNKERAGKPDVFQYDTLPKPFRVQVIHILRDAIGVGGNHVGARVPNLAWQRIHDQLARELGMFELAEGDTPFDRCTTFLLDSQTSDALDLIEWSFRIITRSIPKFRGEPDWYRPEQDAASAVRELNHRFLEHSIGYEFINGELIRKDSQYVHAEAVRPALQLLASAKFDGANAEFLRAHEHSRHGRGKEAIVEALKAFESTLKTICDQRGWQYDPKATAKALVNVVMKNGLLPAFTEMQLHGVSNVLESGVPSVRSKLAAHGQGAYLVSVEPHFVAFALHSTAANIVLLVEAHHMKK